jgi:hypothetical protein
MSIVTVLLRRLRDSGDPELSNAMIDSCRCYLAHTFQHPNNGSEEENRLYTFAATEKSQYHSSILGRLDIFEPRLDSHNESYLLLVEEQTRMQWCFYGLYAAHWIAAH